MSNFDEKWQRYKVAAFKQVSSLIKKGVFPMGHGGACNTIVMDWFRRIQKGRPTWLAHRDKESGKVVARSEIPRDKLNKKAERWDALQNTSKFSEDPRFGAARPGGIEAGLAGGSVVLFSKKVNSDIKDVGREAITKMWENRSTTAELNRFYLLSLAAASGPGHSIGLHALPVVNENEPPRSSSTDSLVEISHPSLNIPPNHLHLFDPNHSEWVVPKDESPEFVGEFLEHYYTGYMVPKITSVSVIYIPVWWNTDSPSTSG